jgi:phosphoglycolate phosphatase-like HAD superfamily hydrolase
MTKNGGATRGFHNRMAVVFDFDLTLSAGTIDALLERLGVEDSKGWRENKLQRMIDDGWDEILATGHLLARTAEQHGVCLTRNLVEEVGRSLEAYPGVAETLPALRALGAEVSGGGEVSLYVLSSGFVDMMDKAPGADCFDRVWGSSLHWSEGGELLGVKRTVIHSEKSRYLLALAKGLDMAGANEPQDVHKDKPAEEWHVPLDQMIYVGDGASDIDAFKLMHESGGIAIAVNHSRDSEEWQASEHMFDDAHVENLAPPDFRGGSEMHRSLSLAVEIIGKRIALRALARGE